MAQGPGGQGRVDLGSRGYTLRNLSWSGGKKIGLLLLPCGSRWAWARGPSKKRQHGGVGALSHINKVT